MHNNFSSFVKGIGAGAIIGMAVYAGGSMMMNGDTKSFRRKNVRKKLSVAARSASDIMGNVSSMLR